MVVASVISKYLNQKFSEHRIEKYEITQQINRQQWYECSKWVTENYTSSRMIFNYNSE